jgi:CubicO group peptidase (beta-lactamase class C family)
MSDAGRLAAPALARLHDQMASHVDRGAVPGIVTLVSRGDEVHVDTIGTMALDGSDAMRRDTIFRISSMTKPVTAVAAMSLVEDGTLHIDEPVDRLIPELAHRRVLRRIDGPLDDTVPAVRAITVRDLLTSCMGYGTIVGSPDDYPILGVPRELLLGHGPPEPALPPPPNEWIRRFSALPLMRQPGERWMYHMAYEVLGVLVARATGHSLDAVFRERIFEPLGMTDTEFSVPAPKIDRFATSYSTNPDTGGLDLYDEPANGQWSRPPAFPSGGGGLVSTVDDYVAFGRMLLRGGLVGSEQLLSRESVEAMTTDQLTSEQKEGAGPILDPTRGWGFGMSIVVTPDEVSPAPGRFGWEGGLGTSWCSDRRADLVAILMTQAAWASPEGPDLYGDFWSGVYQAID